MSKHPIKGKKRAKAPASCGETTGGNPPSPKHNKLGEGRSQPSKAIAAEQGRSRPRWMTSQAARRLSGPKTEDGNRRIYRLPVRRWRHEKGRVTSRAGVRVDTDVVFIPFFQVGRTSDRQTSALNRFPLFILRAISRGEVPMTTETAQVLRPAFAGGVHRLG